MEAEYNIEHAREILEPSGLLGKYLLLDERGVWPGIERDLLLLTETEGLRWRPARQLQHLPGAPEVKDTPMLPNPFTARELAAFMLDGAGALVADFYGEWDDGPDPDSLRAIDPDSKARRAVTEAFTAYREAEGIVGPYPRALQADADRAREAYNEANQRANEREGVPGAVPGTDDSTARRARAVASVAAQEAKMHTTIAASRQASEAWLTKMVRCLLEPQAAAPAPVMTDSASSVPSNGLATAQIAVIFDGLPYTAENWTRRASDIKWLEPARERLGAAGGATSLWCPATLARLIHGRGRGAAKQKTLEALNKRFRSNPVLEPWRDAWNQHYEMFNDAD